MDRELFQSGDDPLLDSYLSAADADEKRAALGELITTKIKPLVSMIIRSSFRATLDPEQLTEENQDALDLASDIQTRLIAELSTLADDRSGRQIANLEGYVVAVSRNAFHQYLRKKYPWRRQFRRNLLYVLEKHESFAVWRRGSDDVRFCGLRDSGSKPVSLIESSQLLEKLRPKIAALGLSQERNLIKLVREILLTADAGIPFEMLVKMAADIQGVAVRHQPVPIDGDDDNTQIPATEDPTPSKLEFAEILAIVWAELTTVPSRHAAALLFHMRDANGDAMVHFLPALGIASIRQIAALVQVPADELAAIWNTLPWDDLRIAEFLSAERQQVINLRSTLRLRLRKKISGFEP